MNEWKNNNTDKWKQKKCYNVCGTLKKNKQNIYLFSRKLLSIYVKMPIDHHQIYEPPTKMPIEQKIFNKPLTQKFHAFQIRQKREKKTNVSEEKSWRFGPTKFQATRARTHNKKKNNKPFPNVCVRYFLLSIDRIDHARMTTIN